MLSSLALHAPEHLPSALKQTISKINIFDTSTLLNAFGLVYALGASAYCGFTNSNGHQGLKLTSGAFIAGEFYGLALGINSNSDNAGLEKIIDNLTGMTYLQCLGYALGYSTGVLTR